MKIWYYRNKNNGNLFNSSQELTIENFPDWTQEQIDEYEEITLYEYYGIDPNKQRIDELKKQLAETDYIVIKIYEASILGETALVEELKETYASVLEERQGWREEINRLEGTE